MSSIPHKVTAAFVASCLAAVFPSAQAQVTPGTPATQVPATNTADSSTRTIHGRVTNALTGSGIPRALVHLNSRQVLTDYRGQFEFPQFLDGQGSITVSKPGFSQSADAGDYEMAHKIAVLDSPVEVKLYPDAVITGTVAGPDGLPLSQLQIMLLRANYDSGGLQWNNAGFELTSSRGEYRFQVPAGRYRVVLAYSPRTRETGEAVLPIGFPANLESDTLPFVVLTPGEERRIDLQPRIGPTHPVLVEMEMRLNPRFSAVDSAGSSLTLSYSQGTRPGEYRLDLPSGSYFLHAATDTRDESLVGEMHIIVGSTPVTGLVMHLAALASLPIELAADPIGTSLTSQGQSVTSLGGSSQLPNIPLLNLSLQNVSKAAVSNTSDIHLSTRGNKAFEFRVPPGRYRLTATSGGWYVVSATYGGITNLLTSEIVIAPGSTGSSIQIVAGNQRGVIRGQVAGTASTSWVYLFPNQPALALPNPVSTGSDGSFLASVPVGSYSVVAFDHRIQEDLRSPDAIARLTAGAKVVDVTPGGNSTISLDLSHAKEGAR